MTKLNCMQGNVRVKEMGIIIATIATAQEMKFVLTKDAQKKVILNLKLTFVTIKMKKTPFDIMDKIISNILVSCRNNADCPGYQECHKYLNSANGYCNGKKCKEGKNLLLNYQHKNIYAMFR